MTSSRTRSNGSAAKRSRPAAPSAAVSTVKPALRRPIAVTSRIDGSSSTSRIRASIRSLGARRGRPAIRGSMPAAREPATRGLVEAGSRRVASKAAFSRARCSAWIGSVPRAASTNVSGHQPEDDRHAGCVSPNASMTTP